MGMPEFLRDLRTGTVLARFVPDEKSPTTSEPFTENSSKHTIFGFHVKQVAKVCAFVGLICLFVVFIAVVSNICINGFRSPFASDKTNKNNTYYCIALGVGLLFFIIGVVAHVLIFVGIRKTCPRFITPFLVVYILLLIAEAMLFPKFINYHLKLQFIDTTNNKTRLYPHTLVFPFAVLYLTVMAAQVVALISVYRCGRYLCEKQHAKILEQENIEENGHHVEGKPLLDN